MHKAARNACVDELQSLIVSGKYDINEKDSLNRTPLHIASWAGHYDSVILLLRSKAKIDAVANDNFTALHFTSNVDIMKELVRRNKHLISARVSKGNKTALHLAIQKGNLDVVSCLIQLGSDLNAKTSTGQSCLDLAKTDEMYELLKLAMEENIKKKEEQNNKLKSKIQNNEDSVSIFCDNDNDGVDLNAVNISSSSSGGLLLNDGGICIVDSTNVSEKKEEFVTVNINKEHNHIHNSNTEDMITSEYCNASSDPNNSNDRVDMGDEEPPKKRLKAASTAIVTVKLSHLEHDDF